MDAALPAARLILSSSISFNPVLDTMAPKAMVYIRGDEPLKRKIARDISPLPHLDMDCPPGIVCFGTADALLDIAVPFIEKAETMGIRMELLTARDMPLGFFNPSPWQETVIKASDEFLISLGYLSGPPTIQTRNGATLKKETLPRRPATKANH